MPGRILIIEDNAANLDLMAYLLTAFGHTVFTACEGGEGLTMARRERPDLVICDIQMPDMDDYAVAHEFKADANLHLIPLIAVSAFATMGDRDRALATGFDSYLSKPIHPEAFVPFIESLLPLKQSQQPNVV